MGRTIKRFSQCFRIATLFLLLIFLSASMVTITLAQDFWQQTNGPYGGQVIFCFAVNANYQIFAGTYGGGVFLSTNNGSSWTAVNSGLTNTSVRSLAINSSGYIFAGTEASVFLSTNNGSSWTAVNSGLTNIIVLSLAINASGYIFAGTYGGGVFISTNNGSSWTAVNNGLTNTDVQSLAINASGHIFAGTGGGGVFLSTNNGSSWTAVNSGLTNTEVQSLAINSNDHIFAATGGGGVFLSTNNGSSWTAVNSGLNFSSTYSLAINASGHIFVGDYWGGVFLSTNNGSSWTEVNSGLTNTHVYSLAIDSSGNIFAGTSGGGVFISTNNGSSWTAVNNGLTNANLRSLAINASGYIFAGTEYGGVFRSTNNGSSWTAVNSGLSFLYVQCLVINSSGYVFAGVGGGVFLSTNNGSSWTRVNNGLTNLNLKSLAINASGHIFAATDGGGVFLSTNNGSSWTSVNSGLTTTTVWSLAINASGDIFAGTHGGVFLSTNNGGSWTAVNSGLTNNDIVCLTINASGHIFAGTLGGGVFLSTNNGSGWTAVKSGLTNTYVQSFAINASGHIFAGTDGGGVFLSTNNGSSWTKVNSGLTYNNVLSLAINANGYIFAGTSGALFRSISSTLVPIQPQLSSPSNSATNQSKTATLSWSSSIGATSYHLQVSTESSFATTVYKDSTLTTTSQQVGPLANNMTHYWRVRAKNAYGISDWSSTWNFKTIVAAPVPPQLSSPTNGATNQLITPTLSWSASTGATSYHLQVSTNSSFTTTVYKDSTLTSTSKPVSSLSNNTIYYWRVRAKNAGGISDWSNIWSFTTIAETIIPAAVQLSSPADGATSQPTTITLNWSISPGATSYHLQVSTELSFTTIVSHDSTLTSTSKQVGILANNATYYWRVRAKNAGGISEWSSIWNFKTIIGVPLPPQLSSPSDGTTSQPTTVTLNWNASSGATSYYLQVSTALSFTTIVSKDSTLTSISKQVATLANNTTYYWRVRAKNVGGISEWSHIWDFKTTPTLLVSTIVDFLAEPTVSTDYRLFSVPGEASTLKVSDILSGKEKIDWRMYRDNGSTEDYLVELTSTSALNNGEAYWLLKKGDLDFSRTMTMLSLSEDATTSIALHSGWNIIGNPFEKDVDWPDVLTKNGLSGSTKLLDYSGSYSSSTTLESFKGYHFFNETALSSLRIPYPFGSLGQQNAKPMVFDWKVQLIFESDINQDSENYIGISPNAENELDDLDYHKPPLFMDQGFLYFSRPRWDNTYRLFSSDFRPAVGDGQVWDFDVANPRKSEGRIRVLGIDQIPAEYEVRLINLQDGRSINLRTGNDYRFSSESEKTSFKLMVGKTHFIQEEIAQLVPERFELVQNYPNPFNITTAISFKVPHETEARLEIVSILGKHIKTLIESRFKPGIHAVIWDGKDESGEVVSSGVYLYQLRAEGKITKKMVLIK